MFKKLGLIEERNTDRCKFRLVNKEDIEDIYEILSDEDTISNLNMKLHTNLRDTEALIEDYLLEFKNGNKLPLAIIEKASGNFIGVFLIKLDLYNEDSYEYTVYLKKAFWNMGIYSEILTVMKKFAFEITGTQNFRGYVMEKNIASAKGLEKNNFKLEKIFEVPGIEGKIKSFLITKNEFISENANN